MSVNNTLGASSTNISDIDYLGALSTLGGGAKAGQQAMDIANQLYPQAPEADPWEAAFRFFAKMGEEASKPGSTALGAAVSSMNEPLDYLIKTKANATDTNRARLQAGLQIAPSLKPSSKGKGKGTPVKIVLPDGSVGLAYPDDVIANNLQLYIEGKSNKSTAATSFSKMYDDLGTAQDEAKANAAQFLVDNPLATPEDIAAAAEADSAVQEANTLQKQIDAAALAAGFNKEIFKAEGELRKEWKKFETPYDEIEIKHQKLVKALKRQSGVGDMSAIFVYMKMLDEGSVVRESEFAQAQQTAGAVESLIVKMKQIAVGEKLSPEQRQEFLALAEEFRNLSKSYVGQNRLDLGTIVFNNTSLKPSNIFGSELAPANFYLDTNVYRQANSLGFSMDEVWEGMTDEEKADYLPSGDN